jgi:hypothetical protein
MNQNLSQNWSFYFANPTNPQIDGIVNRINLFKRSAYVTIIGNEPGHYGALVGIVVFNNARTLNWLQNNISPIVQWEIPNINPNLWKAHVQEIIHDDISLWNWVEINDNAL